MVFGKFIAAVAYVWCIMIGAAMIALTPHGLVVICIGCNSPIVTFAGVTSVVLGSVGLISSRTVGRAAQR